MPVNLIDVDPEAIPSSWLKLAWARHHLDALQEDAENFERSQAATVTPEFKPKRPGYDLRFLVLKPTRVTIPAGAGDAIGCMRDCLDHLVYELTVAYSGAVRPGFKPAFPVCERRSQWPMLSSKNKINKQSGQWKVCGIDPRAQALVYRLQPFYRKHGNGPFRAPHLLWVLDELRNLDRHRRLSLIALGVTHGSTRVTRPPHIAIVREWSRRRPPTHRTVVQRIWLSPGSKETEVRVEPDFTYKVGFDEPTAFKQLTQVVGTLWELHSWLQARLAEFQVFQATRHQEFMEALVPPG